MNKTANLNIYVPYNCFTFFPLTIFLLLFVLTYYSFQFAYFSNNFKISFRLLFINIHSHSLMFNSFVGIVMLNIV